MAETLLQQTRYASANSAEVASRFQVSAAAGRCAPRTAAARAAPESDDLARAA